MTSRTDKQWFSVSFSITLNWQCLPYENKKLSIIATMNVSLANPMKAWVENQIESGLCSNTSDYVHDLIRPASSLSKRTLDESLKTISLVSNQQQATQLKIERQKKFMVLMPKS